MLANDPNEDVEISRGRPFPKLAEGSMLRRANVGGRMDGGS